MKNASNNIHFGFDENEYLQNVTFYYSPKENNEGNDSEQNKESLEIGLEKLKDLHDFFSENHPEIDIGDNIVDFINYLASIEYTELKDLIENTQDESE